MIDSQGEAPDPQPAVQRPPRPAWYRRRDPLSPHQASRRLSAYVYGNILILAALVPFQDDTDVRHAMLVVIGTALSTFIAHAFSEFLGGDGSVHPLELLRESSPILTTALVPLLMLLISRAGRLEPHTAILVAELIIIGRIASTGMVAARLRDEKSRLRILLSGIIVGGVALLIVL
ncbi:MAG TPA: hypothetical protein VIU11_17815, partial [Nakamurella sp.]